MLHSPHVRPRASVYVRAGVHSCRCPFEEVQLFLWSPPMRPTTHSDCGVRTAASRLRLPAAAQELWNAKVGLWQSKWPVPLKLTEEFQTVFTEISSHTFQFTRAWDEGQALGDITREHVLEVCAGGRCGAGQGPHAVRRCFDAVVAAAVSVMSG